MCCHWNFLFYFVLIKFLKKLEFERKEIGELVSSETF